MSDVLHYMLLGGALGLLAFVGLLAAAAPRSSRRFAPYQRRPAELPVARVVTAGERR